MKTVVYLLIFALLCLAAVAFLACSSIPTLTPGPGDTPGIVKLVVIALLALYELIARIIPTIQDWSFISWIIKFLKWLSDSLNNRIG